MDILLIFSDEWKVFVIFLNNAQFCFHRLHGKNKHLKLRSTWTCMNLCIPPFFLRTETREVIQPNFAYLKNMDTLCDGQED